MNRDWANEQGGRTSKTPTCLLLNSDLSFDSFGYEAVEKYAGIQEECHEGEYLFFQRFKMDLHNDKVMIALIITLLFSTLSVAHNKLA